jgi:hypothetical protein
MNSDQYGIDHLPQLPVTVWYVIIIAAALLGLALLRHFSFSADVKA